MGGARAAQAHYPLDCISEPNIMSAVPQPDNHLDERSDIPDIPTNSASILAASSNAESARQVTALPPPPASWFPLHEWDPMDVNCHFIGSESVTRILNIGTRFLSAPKHRALRLALHTLSFNLVHPHLTNHVDSIEDFDERIQRDRPGMLVSAQLLSAYYGSAPKRCPATDTDPVRHELEQMQQGFDDLAARLDNDSMSVRETLENFAKLYMASDWLTEESRAQPVRDAPPVDPEFEYTE